ncbi:MAG: hypothetical protein Ct9H300mP12_09360 [Acidimicrobiales bacterium]|nr:MAG: hypothetical protein Ct9H300mP12_09360 [Acidimicrobiales bacterium]
MTRAAFEKPLPWSWPSGVRPTPCSTSWPSLSKPGRMELEDFNRVAAKFPHLADTNRTEVPHGRHRPHRWVPVGMQMLQMRDLHADEITVTGRAVAENLAMLEVPAPDGRSSTFSDPINALGLWALLRGSLAPEGSVVKVAGMT